MHGARLSSHGTRPSSAPWRRTGERKDAERVAKGAGRWSPPFPHACQSCIRGLMVAGLLLALASGCTSRDARHASTGGAQASALSQRDQSEPYGNGSGDASALEDRVTLWEACSRQEIEQLAAEADADGLKALRAAACLAALVMRTSGSSASTSLSDAQVGRELAEKAVRAFPRSGMAHYLLALLTGMEAERHPASGLQLVPVIEREALLAAKLGPGIDGGGPDRILGELYLRAPGFPMSVGDSEQSEVHFRRALTHDPERLENRLGLAEALMAREKNGEACRELGIVIAGLVSESQRSELIRNTLNAMGKLCGQFGED